MIEKSFSENFEKFFSENIEINNRVWPLFKGIKPPEGFIPMKVMKYLRKKGQLDILEEVIEEVLLRVCQCITNKKIDPVNSDKEKVLLKLIVPHIIPQAASHIKKDDKIVITNDKIEIRDGKLYKIINYRRERENAKRELLGTLIPTDNDSDEPQKKYSYEEENSMKRKVVRVNNSGYITLFVSNCSLIKTDINGDENELQIIYEDKEFEKNTDESLIFSICKRILQIKKEDAFKKLLYIYYVLEAYESKESEFDISRINNSLLDFLDKPLSYLSDYIIKHYLVRYRDRLRNSIELEINIIKNRTIKELAHEGGNYSSEEVDWRKRINEWRGRTSEKFCYLCENEYKDSGLLLKYIKDYKEDYFDMAVYVISRVGKPTFLNIKALYKKISDKNYKNILLIIQTEKIDAQLKSYGQSIYIDQMSKILKELDKHLEKYPLDLMGIDRYKDENTLSSVLKNISKDLHKVLFNELNYSSVHKEVYI